MPPFVRRPGLGLSLLACALLLGGCGGGPVRPPKEPGGDWRNIPDATPKWEPRSRYGNPESYEVFGRRYKVMASANGFVERGIASWYGPDFHGKRTSSGEQYDMHAMTAAHKTLPLPTYARVTNLDNGRTAVVKVNDRGPFKDDRVIDLSFTAAKKLGVDGPGTARVEVRAITPGQEESGTLMAANEPAATAGVTAAPAVLDNSVGAKPLPMEPLPTPTPAPVARPVPASAPPATTGATTAAGRPEQPEKLTFYLQAGAFANRDLAEKLRVKLAKSVEQPVMIQPYRQGEKLLHRVRFGPFTSFEEADRYAVDMSSRGFDRPLVAVEH